MAQQIALKATSGRHSSRRMRTQRLPSLEVIQHRIEAPDGADRSVSRGCRPPRQCRATQRGRVHLSSALPTRAVRAGGAPDTDTATRRRATLSRVSDLPHVSSSQGPKARRAAACMRRIFVELPRHRRDDPMDRVQPASGPTCSNARGDLHHPPDLLEQSCAPAND